MSDAPRTPQSSNNVDDWYERGWNVDSHVPRGYTVMCDIPGCDHVFTNGETRLNRRDMNVCMDCGRSKDPENNHEPTSRISRTTNAPSRDSRFAGLTARCLNFDDEEIHEESSVSPLILEPN